MLFIKIDSNPGPLVLEATALLTVPRNDPSKLFEKHGNLIYFLFKTIKLIKLIKLN